MTQDLIVFDTCTLPEYYDDVHKILALPPGHVVTYDYSAGHVSAAAQNVLRTKTSAPSTEVRAVLAYIQSPAYRKGEGTTSSEVLDERSFQTLTRLASIVEVREVPQTGVSRFYFDLKLEGYPPDKDRSIANAVVAELRTVGEIPMKTYVAVYPGDPPERLFTGLAERSLERGFAQAVDALSSSPSQFIEDTFWRISRITNRTKSLVPLVATAPTSLSAQIGTNGDKRYSFLEVVDQSAIELQIQYHRGQEHGKDYRLRRISIEASPKSSSDLVQSSFATRSFGREVVALTVPSTSSLSRQEARFQISTNLHDDDEQKDYCYGPQISIAVRYRKAPGRSILAIGMICFASALFAWAGFSTSVATANPVIGSIVPIACRLASVVVGVIASLYAYYLWSDDVTLDKARRT